MKKINILALGIMAYIVFLSLGCGSGGGGGGNSETGEIQKEEQFGKVAFHIQLDSGGQLNGTAKRLYRIPANTTGILVRAWDDAGHDVLTEIPI